MKIGYPCLNLSIDCASSKTFRLANWSEDRFIETVDANLSCLQKTLEFNQKEGLLFFRICSGLVPFASHPINRYPWQQHFEVTFKKLGKFIKDSGMRVSLHPDQFILINSPNSNVLHSSIRELVYHAQILELMGLDHTHKIQIHVGGAYGDKKSSIVKFIKEYGSLPEIVKRRLVIENDDRLFSVSDCQEIHQVLNIPIVFDYLHHQIHNNEENFLIAFESCVKTWKESDGPAIIDYSSQSSTKRPGAHAESLDINDFKKFFDATKHFNYDLMLEIKDKETSALRALKILTSNEKS